MECHRKRDSAKEENVDSDGSTSDDELEVDSNSSNSSQLRRQKCQNNWSVLNKVRREEERLRARQKASSLVRSMSDDNTPAKSPLKLSRKKDGRSRRSSLKARRTPTSKSAEPTKEGEGEEKKDDEGEDSDVPTLLRRVSDELLKFFGEEEGAENAKEKIVPCSATPNDPANTGQLEPETLPFEPCDTIRSLRRKDSIVCRTFTNTQPSTEKETMKKDAQTAARRHKAQLSSKYKNMVEKAGASKSSLFGESRASLLLDGELSLTNLQYDHNQSFSDSRRADMDFFNASFSLPIKNKKGIRLHSTSMIQHQKQTVQDPLSSQVQLSCPPDFKREISLEALKASISQEKEMKESPVVVKRDLGAKKMFGHMVGAFQDRLD